MLRIAPLSFVVASSLLAPPSTAQETAPVEAPPKEKPAAVEEPVAAPEEVPNQVPAEEPAPRTSAERDWVQWERVGATALSPDGRWVAYGIGRGDGTSDLLLRVVATQATETFKQGGAPEFSRDGKWLAFSITKSQDERDELSKKEEPVEDGLGLFDLVLGGDPQTVDGIANFGFSPGGAFLAMRRVGEKGEETGADLLIREMATGRDTHFGRVGSFAWADEGPWLAMTVDAPGKTGNAVRIVNAKSGVMRTLESAEADFVGLTWREDSMDLAVMAKIEHEDDEDATFTVMAFADAAAEEPKVTRYDHLEDKTFPEDLHVVDRGGLRWSDDGAALYFGLSKWDEKPASLEAPEEDSEVTPTEESKEESSDTPKEEDGKQDSTTKSLREKLDEAPGVEIWHAKDINIVPSQKRSASADEQATHVAALWLSGDDSPRLVRLQDDELRDVEILEGQRAGIGYDDAPYEEEQRFSATVADIYAIDAMTGERARVLERVKYTSTGDPKGRHFLFVRNDHVWSFDLETRREVNLTANTDTAFINQENSSLTDQKPMYGVAGWLEDGSGAILNSRYDLWSFTFDGSESERLTRGAETSIRHRRVRIAADKDDDRFINLDEGFYISLYGDRTKTSGYGHFKDGSLKSLISDDARISRLRAAEDADVVVFMQERFDDSPDLFVSNSSLKNPKQVSNTNEFAKDFAWGHSELVDYENANGFPLQGALFYPADYDETKTYPMVVYIYELRSQSLHQYQNPSETHPYNTSVFTQNGYFVFQPDIVYRAQNPGISAVECVVPAVRKVLEDGKVDPKRVGLVGHSWGAYQTAFIVTQTDLFAAGVAGAPLTNMMSMSMSIYWNSGQTDAYIFHESQGRMDRPFWRDVDTYMANSPIFSIENLNTPLLVAFGDDDGAVDWQQGVEMYNAARLAQRPFVMLVYPGENHGLAKRPNQIDYHHRVRSWFDTHLMDKEAPAWITDGLPWLEQKDLLEEMVPNKKSKKKD